MRRLTYIIAMLMLLLCSCRRAQNPVRRDGPAKRVAVVFSCDSLMECYHAYDSVLARRFYDAGLNVDLHRFYLDNPVFEKQDPQNQDLASSLTAFQPDIIITEGDVASYTMMLVRQEVGEEIPMVCGGLTAVDWQRVRADRNCYVWYNIPDYAGIVMEIRNIMHTDVILTELDYGYQDSLIAKQIKEVLTGQPFVDCIHGLNSRLFGLCHGRTAYRDSLVVASFSQAASQRSTSPQCQAELSLPDRHDAISSLMSLYPVLNVKQDCFAMNAVHVSPLPSFTCLPYRFGEEGSQFLAGFFVPSAVEAADVSQTAIALLQGQSEGLMRGSMHEAEAYMDYNLMTSLGLDYRLMQDGYVVVNVPASVSDPIFGNRRINVIVAILFFGAVILLALFFWSYSQTIQRRLRKMRPGNFRMLSSQASIFRYIEGGEIEIDTYNLGEDTQHVRFSLEQFFSVVMPESKNAAEEFENGLHEPGYYSIDMRVSFNDGQDCHWWRYRFITMRNTLRRRTESYGVLMLIDNEVTKKQEMESMKLLAREMESRENFLHSMNHEIRTPLNIVLGCSQLLAMPDVLQSDDELAEVLNSMRLASDQLMGLVQDILSYSRIGSGRMSFIMEPMQVDKLMEGLFSIHQSHFQQKPFLDENNVDKTGLLTLTLVPGTRGLCVMLDNNCIQLIIQHLISNAVKFTDRGEIRLGWRYHMSSREMEMFVEDSGMGIAPEKQQRLWHAFFKNDTCSTGVGLGLTLVQTMTERMKGRVEVDSSVGVGSRFSIYFPVV